MPITISVFDPLVKSDNFIENINSTQNTYRHTINTFGGYWDASFTISDKQEKLENWLSDGLGRHIEVFDEAQNKIWEGFINEIRLGLGGLQVTRGPLLNIGNRVRLMYSTVDTTTSPPIVGIRTTTAISNDTDSQSLFGIINKILSSGGTTSTDADEIVSNYLAEYTQPDTSQSLTNQRSSLNVQVSCLGYFHWLNYPYNNTTTGTQNLSTKIEAILGDDPNGFISSDFSKITANTLQVPAFENDNDIAMGLIKGLVSLGDTSDNRHTFGIYSDRIAEYEAIPTDIAYQNRLSDPEQRIETLTGKRVNPWNVLPARWLFIPDFLIGQSIPDNLRDDPRSIFIESVTYTAPWGISIQGGKTDRLSQKLARLGLGGIGI